MFFFITISDTIRINKFLKAVGSNREANQRITDLIQHERELLTIFSGSSLSLYFPLHLL